jgi:hypothetical protein
MRWQFKEHFSNKREKLVQLLFSELMFLDKCIKSTQKRNEKRFIRSAYKKIEKLLEKNQKNIDEILAEKDYENTLLVLFNIIKDITNKIG